MRLQILINHYRESPELIGRLLMSIAEQNASPDNYSVIIASDGADSPLDMAFLDSFPFSIGYAVLPHKGVCPTRNTLLDMATADYVMFCDADDCFKSAHGISTLLKAAESGADVVGAPFDAELENSGEYRYVTIPNNAIWIHGQIFRRGYLTENGIRFDDAGDSPGEQYFLWQAFKLTKNIRRLSESHYVWKWNAGSVTRKEPFYNIRTYKEMLETYSRLADNLLARRRFDLYADLIATIISAAYLDSRPGNWDAAPPECVNTAKSAITEYVRRYRAHYEAIGEDFRRGRYNAELVSKRVYGPPAGFCGIAAWMDALENERKWTK